MKYAYQTITTRAKVLILLALLCCIPLAGCGAPSVQADYSEYTKLYSADDLRAVRDDLNGRYVLMADIDLSGAEWMPIGDVEQPFTGVFDGNGHRVAGMTVECSGSGDITGGLFGKISRAVVRNVLVENSSVIIRVTGDDSSAIAAGVVGWAIEDSLVEQCGFSGKVEAIGEDGKACGGAGGVVGILDGSTIRNCYANATLRAECCENIVLAGGVCGKANNDSVVAYCYSAGKVHISAEADEATCLVGGIVAWGKDALVQRDVVLLSQIMVDGSKGMAGEVIPVSEGDTTLIVEDCAVVRDLASNISLQQSMDTLRVSRFSSTHGRFYRILGWDMGHIWAVSLDEMPQLRLSEG